MEFYEKLIRLRKSRRMTQSDLAAVLGVSRQAVYKWECGQSYPEAMKLVSLKQLFGISIDDLLDPDYIVEAPLRARKEKIRNAAQTPAAAPNPPVGTVGYGTAPTTTAAAEDETADSEAPETVALHAATVGADTMTAEETSHAVETIPTAGTAGVDSADLPVDEAAGEDVTAVPAEETPAADFSAPTTAPAVVTETVSDDTVAAAPKAAEPAAPETTATAAPEADVKAPQDDRKAADLPETPASSPAKEEKPKKKSFFARLFGRK